LVTRRPQKGQRCDSEFFTTWQTMEDGEWRSDLVNGLLQIRPSEHYGLRCFAQEFEALGDLQVAVSTAQANPSYGAGGGQKLFVPAALHARGLSPVGEPIPLAVPGCRANAEPKGFFAEVIQLELSQGNSLFAADVTDSAPGRSRFWMQEPLHLDAIQRALRLPLSTRLFQEEDIYGSVQGFFELEGAQVVIAPMKTSVVRESWLRRLFRPSHR
jgi:hypothetical protein